MSKGKWTAMRPFRRDRFEKLREKKGFITDRAFCDYLSNQSEVTCSPSHLSRAKKSRTISQAILERMAEVLEVPPEYLSGEISEDMLDMVFNGKTPDPAFHEEQKYYNLSDDMKEVLFKYELIDLGVYYKWLKMDDKQRSYCHVTIKAFSSWLLDYMQPDEKGYSEMLEFFEKTGAQMEADPDRREKLFSALAAVYKMFIEIQK